MTEMDAKEGVEMASSLLDTGWSIGKDVAKALPTHRECKVHITNECSKYTLLYVTPGKGFFKGHYFHI